VLFGGLERGGAGPRSGALSQKGSLYVTRPTLVNYIATRDELVARSSAVVWHDGDREASVCASSIQTVSQSAAWPS